MSETTNDQEARLEHVMFLWASGMRPHDMLGWCNTQPTDEHSTAKDDGTGRPWNIERTTLATLITQARARIMAEAEPGTTEGQAKVLFRLGSAHSELVQSGDIKAAAQIAIQISKIHRADMQRREEQAREARRSPLDRALDKLSEPRRTGT